MENIYIQLTDEKGKSSLHNIPLKSTLTVGTAQTCDVIVSGRNVLPIHAIIEAYDLSSIFIRSLNPQSKILVNDKPQDRAKVGPSDIVKIGDAKLQIKTAPDTKKEVPLEKTLSALTPESEKKEEAPIFKSPLSEDEIEKSIKIPKAKTGRVSAGRTEPHPAEKEFSRRPQEPKETTIARKIVQSSSSLRIRQFWWDIIVSDKLYNLESTITIGPSNRNTYVVPPNGLPKRLPIFTFQEFQPFLVLSDHLTGHINTKGEKISFEKARERLPVTTYKGSQSKVKLGFDDSGEITHGNIKFLFEFVETPAPAPREKFFARMDKLYKRSLIAGAILCLLLFLFFFIIAPPKRILAKKPDRIAIPGANLAPIVRTIRKPKPVIVRARGGRRGREGEGARAPGKEGRRGKSVPGKKGKGPSQIDIIRERGVGALMAFRDSSVLRDIAGGGGGGDLARATRRMRPGLPGETVERKGLGLRGTGTGGGNKAFVGSGMGLGKKGKGLGGKGTGKADWGSRGEAQVSVAGLEDEKVFQGEMDPSIIEKLIKDNLGYIKWCYEKELNQHPDLSGKIVVDFVIGVEGRVTASKVKKSTMGNYNVESCITRRIKYIKFPSPGAGIVQVFYPFIFRVAGGL